jgi:hypothetical protein
MKFQGAISLSAMATLSSAVAVVRGSANAPTNNYIDRVVDGGGGGGMDDGRQSAAQHRAQKSRRMAERRARVIAAIAASSSAASNENVDGNPRRGGPAEEEEEEKEMARSTTRRSLTRMTTDDLERAYDAAEASSKMAGLRVDEFNAGGGFIRDAARELRENEGGGGRRMWGNGNNNDPYVSYAGFADETGYYGECI